MTKRKLVILAVALGTLTLGMIPAAAQPPEGVPPVDVPVQPPVDIEVPDVGDLPDLPDLPEQAADVEAIHAAIQEFVDAVRGCTEDASEDPEGVSVCLDEIFDGTEFNSLGEQVSGIARNGFGIS